MSERSGGYLNQVFSLLGLRRRGGTHAAAATPPQDELEPAVSPRGEAAEPAPPNGAAAASQLASDRQAFETGLRQFRSLRAMAGCVAGRVHILNTDLVRQRLGKRWPRLEQRIHDLIKGELRRRLGPHDLFTRVDDSTYVLVFGDCTELEAQVKIALLSERLLEKLLGEDEAKQLDALGVQRLFMQVDGRVARDALQSIESLMARFDGAQAAGPQPAAHYCSDAAAGKRALPPQHIAQLVGTLRGSLDEIVADDGGQAEPLIKVDRLRQLVRQLEELEEAVGLAEPDGRAAAGGEAEESALQWVQDLKSKAERQLVFLYDRDPRRAADGAAPDDLVQLDFSYLPMWHAPSQKVGIYLCQASVADPGGRLLLPETPRRRADRDAVEVADRLLLRRVLEDIERGMTEKSPYIVAAPVHFSSLQPERSRVRLLDLCRDMPDGHRSRLLWEIVGAHFESWSFQLPDILRHLRVFAPAVFLRLDGVERQFADIRQAFRHLRRAGVHAVGLDVGKLPGGESDKLAVLEAVARRANELGLKCYGHGFDSLSLTSGAVKLGFQHVSGPAIAEPLPRPAGIQATKIEALQQRGPQKRPGGGTG